MKGRLRAVFFVGMKNKPLDLPPAVSRAFQVFQCECGEKS